ncbi:cold-shock protein [Microvirga aerophila]|uniref:cold-shock protein n=1 Tax=Microvirga aerophila TaxID=670291 RepID=UPI001FF06173|nr:cold shock protein [Microvirga aerophila]
MKWFNPAKSFGFIELTDGSGEAFLHARQVEAAGHSTLAPGTTLVVQVGPGQKGSQVKEIVSVDVSTAVPESSRRTPRVGQESSRSNGGAPEIAGIVKWYDPVKGFGFISVESESRDLLVHVSVVERAGLHALEQG